MEYAHLGKSSLKRIQATEKMACGNMNRMTRLDNKKRDEEMAYLLQCLLCTHDNMSSIFDTHIK